MTEPLRIVGFAGSTRRGSLNRRLLARAMEALGADTRVAVETEILDLRAHPLPIYDADLQARDGIPTSVTGIQERIASAHGVLITVPEYNGGYPALLKNVIDWVTRVDMFTFLERYVGLLAASPGGGGGTRGREHLDALFGNMFVTTHEGFSLPKAHEALAPEGWSDDPGDAPRALATWADGYLTALLERVEQADQSANA